MKITDIMRSRGSVTVVTVAPDDTVSTLLGVLAEHRIGAVVVSADGTSLDGIVSERDVVRALHERGPGLLEESVADIMTSSVLTCEPGHDLATIAATMTQHRIRHLPVLQDGLVTSIVSIGDVVKARIEQLQQERDQLVEYIHR